LLNKLSACSLPIKNQKTILLALTFYVGMHLNLVVHGSMLVSAHTSFATTAKVRMICPNQKE
jgi:hypothetical protein